MSEQVSLDPDRNSETGEVVQPPTRPRWMSERQGGPGGERKGATAGTKLPRTLPGGRALRGAKGK